jgi:hypothetical protein
MSLITVEYSANESMEDVIRRVFPKRIALLPPGSSHAGFDGDVREALAV